MTRGVWLGLVAGVLFAALSPASRAGEKYQVRLTAPREGSQTSAEFDSRVRITLQKWNLTGQLVRDDLHVTSYQVHSDDKVLEGKGDDPARCVRHFQLAKVKVNGEETAMPFEGQTWVIEHKDGQTKVSTPKGEPLPADLVEKMLGTYRVLHQCRTRYEDLVPSRAVAEGESWDIDAASWVRRDDVAATATGATGKPVKVIR